MCEEINEDQETIRIMAAHLFAYVRSLIKDERVIVTIVRESLEALDRTKITGKENIKSFLVTCAHDYSLNYLKKKQNAICT